MQYNRAKPTREYQFIFLIDCGVCHSYFSSLLCVCAHECFRAQQRSVRARDNTNADISRIAHLCHGLGTNKQLALFSATKF